MPLTKIKSLGITDGTIVNADINASAAIDATKLSGVQGKFESQLLHVRDEKASGTDGGDLNSGSWSKRTLNTTLTNEISGASISSSVITLPSGTYYINASAPSYAQGVSKLKLRNTSDSTDTLIGTAEYVVDTQNVQVRSFVIGRFTISAQKNFELQHRVSTSRGGNGAGVPSGFSVVEVFADVQIWKVA